MESFKDEIADMIKRSEALKSSSKEDEDNWEILGLRAYKVPNDNVTTFNILQSSPPATRPIKVAEFDNSVKSSIQLYGYARSI